MFCALSVISLFTAKKKDEHSLNVLFNDFCHELFGRICSSLVQDFYFSV